ncbi:hypothetical protein IPA_00320 [Ignicoccus pacificus DSM 13166]|uniref:Uncharacterized protein n=1 Tax=Ignicoccus pacificus DSM 13166 TaxID=940294 RepID=A0A977KAB6_9CREN|nr:hypothetical protein IPA_00320 [Ignicoccus pacificus DSM 13166]
MKKIRSGLTLQDALYIAMIIWVGLSILALLYDLVIVGINLLHGNYNVTIPLKVGLTIPTA